MPQITLEYTDNIKDAVEYPAFFAELHKIIHQITDANIESCKSRAKKIDCYYMGSGGNEKAFVHLELYLLAGRELAIKQALGEAVLKLLQRYYPQSLAALDLQISVKVDDIKRETYFKYPA